MPKRYGLEISVKLPQVFYLEVDDNDAGVVDSWQLVCYDGKYPSRHFQWDSKEDLEEFLATIDTDEIVDQLADMLFDAFQKRICKGTILSYLRCQSPVIEKEVAL